MGTGEVNLALKQGQKLQTGRLANGLDRLSVSGTKVSIYPYRAWIITGLALLSWALVWVAAFGFMML
jgi:hypothetical protein